MDVAPGPDGTPRCSWCLGADEYVEYHDRQWGRPERDDARLFEMLTLESFQSGLSWLTILRKREGFRQAFAGWDVARIAEFGDADVERLLQDAGIVRHRGKIEAALANARAVRELQAGGEALAELLWRFEPAPRTTPPAALSDLDAATPESTAMSKELRRRGFRFVGPTTAYSLMQAVGIVDDHLAGCAFRTA